MYKYTDDEISEIISSFGFKLIEYNGVKKIIAIDNYGYKYKLTLSNLQIGKIPSRWMKNPFATENIKIYLQNHCPNYEWIDNETYKGCKYKHQFICHNHINKGIQYNSFDNIINNHHTCKYCGYEDLSKIKQLPVDKLERLCKERDVLFKGRYSKDCETQVQYMCKNHPNYIQEMSLTHFKESHIPCKYCSISAGEKKISEYLISNNICYTPQKRFKDCTYEKELKFDFYLDDKNTCIEYDGQQHFYPVNFSGDADNGLRSFELTKIRDRIKNDYCKQKGIKLIRIPYWDYDNIEEILQCKI